MKHLNILFVTMLLFAVFFSAQAQRVSTATVIYNTAVTGGTYTIPANVKQIKVELWGAGGGGGYAADRSASSAGGGGGGAYAASTLTVTPSSTINYTVGKGGAGGIATTEGTKTAAKDGTATTLTYGSTITANPGKAGQDCYYISSANYRTVGAGGAGGAAASGAGSFAGGKGAAGRTGYGAGGGGGSAGSLSNGEDAKGKEGGVAGAGGGAAGGSGFFQIDGQAGNNPGAGGGGADYDDTKALSGSAGNKSGGSGADGQIILTLYYDNDNDGLLDIDDLDDDNDGILDKDEMDCTIHTETFSPNYDTYRIGYGSPFNTIDGNLTTHATLWGPYDAPYYYYIDYNFERTLPAGTIIEITYASKKPGKSIVVGTGQGLGGIYSNEKLYTATAGDTKYTVEYTLSTSAQYFGIKNQNSVSTDDILIYEVKVSYQMTECHDIDTDGDGTVDRLDLDSDGDGCFDALEGDENVLPSHLYTSTADATFQGTIGVDAAGNPTANNVAAVDANGVPLLVNSGGKADVGGDVAQGIGGSRVYSVMSVALDNVTACATSDAVFSAAYTETVKYGAAVPATYQWMQSTDGGNTFTNYTGTGATGTITNGNTTSITIPNTTTAMSGTIYKVVFDNPNNTCGLQAQSVLTVNPIAVIQDASYTIPSGGTFSYTPADSTFNTIPAEGVTYTWVPEKTLLGVGGIAEGSDANTISGTITNYCAYEHTITYIVTATTKNGGCPTVFKVNVEIAPAEDNCGHIWYGYLQGAATDAKGSIGKVSDDRVTLTPTSEHSVTAVAIYNYNPSYVYHVEGSATTSTSRIDIYDNTSGVDHAGAIALPSGVSVRSMAFDKMGNLYFIDKNTNNIYMYPGAGRITSGTADQWVNKGTLTGVSEVGDIAFNWGGSMYIVGGNNSLYVVNPLQLEGTDGAAADLVGAIPGTTGITLTGIASHLDKRTFFISGVDEQKSYLYEIDIKGGTLKAVGETKTITDGLISDLASCCLPQNLWVGSTDTDSDKGENWSYGFVPRDGEDVEFANGKSNNPQGTEAANDLSINKDHTAGNLINATNLATVITPGVSLTVNGQLFGSETNPNKLKVLASGDGTTPNGSLILAGQPCDDKVMGTVQMYAKGFKDEKTTWIDNIVGSPTNGQTFSASYHWQYFGVPVKAVQADPTFYGSFIRKYNEGLNGTSYYQKWEPLGNSSILEAFKGYEITQKAKKIIEMQGELVFCDKTLTMTRKAPAVAGASGDNMYYGLGQNIFGNSFTSAIKIDKMGIPDVVEKTVYLYNTGRFTDWGNDGTTHDGSTIAAGTYTAVPVNTSIVWDNQIPSMQGFLLKFTAAETTLNGADATVTLKYADGGVVKNTKPQLVKRAGGAAMQQAAPASKEELSYMRVNLASNSTRDVLWLFSQEGTTEGFDNGWDGRKFFGTPTAFIYTETPDGPMQVNTNSTINGTYITLYTNKDTDYTLTLVKTNLDNYKDLVLQDLKTGTITPLTGDSTVYKFTSDNTNNAEKRFLLSGKYNISTDNSQDADNSKLSGYYVAPERTLILDNFTDAEGMYYIYSPSGVLITNGKLEEGSARYPVSLKPGAYTVRMQAGNVQKVIKVLVNNKYK